MPISNRHQLLKYPEYISPLPADQLIKVGMVKQQLYDEGVGKIEKRIDELDQYGLTILKEEDKKYFSQEMDKFMQAVNESSAKTDFSNMNNVRKVLSIAKPIENDPYIMNAIQSSAEISRRQKILGSLKPDERSAANDYDFMQEAYSYLDDKTVGSRIGNIGKAYTPHRDLSKKYMDVVAKLKPNITSKPTFTADGKWIITNTVEGLDAAKLQEAFNAVLDESDRNQLRIDTNYDLKVRGRDLVAQDYLQYNKNAVLETGQSIEATKTWISQMEEVLAKTPDPATRQKVDETKSILNQLEVRQKIFADNAAKRLDQITNNDLVDYHTKNFIANQANAYVYRQEKQDLKENPYAIEEIRYSRSIALENLRDLHENQRAERNFLYEQLKGKELEEYGGEFGGIFAPMQGFEKLGLGGSYAQRVSKPDGWTKLYIGDWRSQKGKEELIKEWQTAYNEYNGGKNTLDKLKGLKKLLEFSYDGNAIKGDAQSEAISKGVGIKEGVSDLNMTKEKNRTKEIVNNLISSYEKINNYKNEKGTIIRLIYPDKTFTNVPVSTFLNMELNQLATVNPSIQLFKEGKKDKPEFTLEFLSSQLGRTIKEKDGVQYPYIAPPGGFKQYIEQNYPGVSVGELPSTIK